MICKKFDTKKKDLPDNIFLWNLVWLMHYPSCLSKKKFFIKILGFGCSGYSEVHLGIHEICLQQKSSILMGYYISLECLSHQLSNAPIIKKYGWSYQKLYQKKWKIFNIFWHFLKMSFFGYWCKNRYNFFNLMSFFSKFSITTQNYTLFMNIR